MRIDGFDFLYLVLFMLRLLDSGSFRLAFLLADSFCFFRIALYLGVNSLAFTIALTSGLCLYSLS